MKKIIDPGREPVIQYYCDGCKKLLYNEESPADFCLQIVGNFGFGSNLDGLVFNHSYCSDCGEKAIEAVQLALKIKIEPGDNILFPCDESI